MPMSKSIKPVINTGGDGDGVQMNMSVKQSHHGGVFKAILNQLRVIRRFVLN